MAAVRALFETDAGSAVVLLNETLIRQDHHVESKLWVVVEARCL